MQSKKRFYRPELDILRFFCFLLVFCHHVLFRGQGALANAFIDAGSFGVPVFFLLSSFLITELLLLERQRTGTIHIASFYIRRILRIWPLYFGFFALCWVLPHAFSLMKPIPNTMTAAFLLLVGNWYISMHGNVSNAAGVLWSVSVEEQYYLVWPLLMRSGGSSVLHIVSWAVLPASYLSLYWLAHRGIAPDIGLWSNTFVQMQFFALGALLALHLSVRKLTLSLPARAACLVFTVTVWFIAAFFCRIKRPDDLHIAPASACAGYFLVALGAVAFFLTFYGLQIGNTLISRAMIYLGKISYGLYTFHILGIAIADRLYAYLNPKTIPAVVEIVLSFVITTLAAMASYRFYEAPFLKLKEKFTFVHSRSV